jgi:hypothetical protein
MPAVYKQARNRREHIRVLHRERGGLFAVRKAGRGKTALGAGLALSAHKRSLLSRRVGKDARKLVSSHLIPIVGSKVGFNAQDSRWIGGAIGDRQIDIGGCETGDDKQRYKGDPHDFIYFDK